MAAARTSTLSRYNAFKASTSEEACLNELMRLRFGGTNTACPACGGPGCLAPALKRRAYVCGDCGHALYPGHGTPFEKLRTPLADWFFAVQLLAGKPHAVARDLMREAGLPRAAAERIEGDLKEFASKCTPDGAFAGWLSAIAKFSASTQGGSAEPSTRALQTSDKARPPVSVRTAATGLRPLVIGLTACIAAGSFGAGFLALIPTLNGGLIAGKDSVPTLSSIPPSPMFTLLAVEEDLAAVRATVEAVVGATQDLPNPATPPRPRVPGANSPGALVPPPGLPESPTEPVIPSRGDPNEILAFGPIKVRRHLVETIVRASRVVGADPTLLMAIADKESSFATEVKARTSSATGLYQFIERTWFGVLLAFGPKHGYEKEARLIVRTSNGYTVADPAERARILDLRRDPYLSALMAGEMLKQDTLRIERRLGRALSGGEIYLIHFLGPDAAQTLINGVEGNPDASAAEMFPRPAEANKSIFYDSDGAKSVAEVREQFDKMIGTRLNRYREVRALMRAMPASASDLLQSER